MTGLGVTAGRITARAMTGRGGWGLYAVLACAAPAAEAQDLVEAPLPAPPSSPFPASVPTSPAAPADGKLHLTLRQAYAMALANNLDLQVEQADQTIAQEGVRAAQGGGLPRAINYTVADAPVGEAAAAVPLFSFSSPGLTPGSVDPIASTVSSSYNTSRVIETAHSLFLGTAPYSAGSPVPGFDAQLLGRYGWLRRNPQVSFLTVPRSSAAPGDTVTTNATLGDTLLTKGFSTGASIQLGVNNFVQSFYSGRSSAVPFSHPDALVLAAQPLLRGAGRANNTRWIAIAKTNTRISAAVLEQQMIGTLAGVGNLYVDLASLQDAVKVQEQAVDAAELLLQNDREQFKVGRLPAVEVARAESLVTGTRVMLEESRSLAEQQGVILRTLIDPQSLTGAGAPLPALVAEDPLPPAPAEGQTSFEELLRQAEASRPDLRQARLQLENGARQVASSANAAKPEVDLYGTYQTRGVIIPGLTAIGDNPLTGNTLINNVPTGGNRSSTLYEAGVQFFLPVQNRVARADLAADKAILRQQQLRVTQLEASVAAEVRNALIALRAAENAAGAAEKARSLQETLLGAAEESFRAGYGTNLAVIEQQTYLAQARTTEVVARAAWLKAAGQLDRVTGQTLARTGITLKQLPAQP